MIKRKKGQQKKRTFKKGAYIFIEGEEKNTSVYVIESGAVRFIHSNQKLRERRTVAKTGDIIGFISCLSDRPRIMSAVSDTDTVVIEFDRTTFLETLKSNTSLAVRVMNIFAEDLRFYNQLVLSIGKGTDYSSDEERLVNLARYYINHESFKAAAYVLRAFFNTYPQSSFTDEAKSLLNPIEKAGMTNIVPPEKEGLNLKFSANDTIFCEYEQGDQLFFIKEGKVKIVKHHQNSEIMLSILGEGEIFGELALVSDKPRNATAVSYTDTILTPIDMSIFNTLIQRSPDLLKRIFNSLSKRVWFTFIRVESKLYNKPLTRIYAFLLNKLLEENVSLQSEKPHKFNFGVDELLRMNEMSPDLMDTELEELFDNPILSFHFGQVYIEHPKEFAAICRVQKERDHLAVQKPEKKKETLQRDEGDDITKPAGPGKKKVLEITDDEFNDTVLARMIDSVTGGKPVGQGKEEDGAEQAESLQTGKEAIARDIELLVRKLEDPNSMNRINACARLAHYGVQAKDAVSTLQRLLTDDNQNVRRNAIKALNAIYSIDEALDYYRNAVNDTNHNIRSAAYTGLGELSLANLKDFVPLFMQGLDDESDTVKYSAARSLGWLGTDSQRAVLHLVEMLESSDSHLKIMITGSLSKIVTPKSKNYKRVKEALDKIKKKDNDPNVRAAAKSAIKGLKSRKK